MSILKDEEVRKFIAVLAKRTDAESIHLFELCQKDIEIYLSLEVVLSLKSPKFIPANREVAGEMLLNNLDVLDDAYWKRFTLESEEVYMRRVGTVYPPGFVEWALGKNKAVVDRLIENYSKEVHKWDHLKTTNSGDV